MPPTAYEVFFGPENRLVTLKLIRYSLYMLLVPLATFYFLYFVVFKQDQAMLGWCGIAAVIAANGVIAAYVMMAWNEDIPPSGRPGALAGPYKSAAIKGNSSGINPGSAQERVVPKEVRVD